MRLTQNTDLIVFPVSFHKKSSLHLLIALASASSASVYTKAQTRMALQICRAYSACWDAIPIPANITFRDGCTLLRSAERAFCKNAKPASARCRTMGLGCAQQASCNASGLCIYKDTACKTARCSRMVPRSTACKSDCVSPNCQFLLQLLYWSHQKFFRRQLP